MNTDMLKDTRTVFEQQLFRSPEFIFKPESVQQIFVSHSPVLLLLSRELLCHEVRLLYS